MATADPFEYQTLVNELSTPGRASEDLVEATGTTVAAVSTTQTDVTAVPVSASLSGGSTSDFRLRLSFLPGYTGGGYTGVLAPLASTGGVLFPYTPTISLSHDVDYTSMSMTHSNTDYYSFTRSQNVSINISARFTVQNQYEGRYSFAAYHFMRSNSKMHFGMNDQNAGLPPPILLLNGYGNYMFNNTRVILRNVSIQFDDNTDLVRVELTDGYVVLPALFSLQVVLVTQNTPRAMREEFSLSDYRSGALLARGGFF